MAIRKVLLPLIGTAGAEAALSTAFLIAGQWTAHMAVLHVAADARHTHPLRVLTHRFLAERHVTIADARAQPGTLSASFNSVTGRAQDLVAEQARIADLTVMPNPGAGEESSSSLALHAVLFDSGRPVVIAPPLPPGSLGTRVCLGWNGTAESASAVAAVLPWLERAQAVRILSAEGYQRRGPAAPELAQYLAAHGIQADWVMFRPINEVVGAGLLAAAAAFGCDLLAMGAYSHSRLRQLILGGVTRHVLEHATLPVVMSR
jgi:nucleotide-binding universal stress UspA family protein